MKLKLIHSLLTGAVALAAAVQTLGAAAPPDPLAFTFETFDVEGGTETLLSDIRNDGALVGRFKDGGGISQGFIREGTNLTTFNVTGTTATFAGGLDSFGRVAGFYCDAVDPDVQHGFIRETNGTFTTLDGPGQTFTYVWRSNDAGQVNGYWFEDPFFITSFRRATNGALTTNVFAGSPIGTVARGMNEAGDTAGWKWDENFTLQGVIFAGGATNVFTVAGWEHTLPGDINNLGEVAGTVNNGFTNTAGFFRRANGDTVVFTPPGAVEVEVFGLNDLGQVVGEYADAGGNRHGFIAHPAVKLPRGHTDIGIAFEDGAFDLHIHDEETDTEYAPGGAVLCVGEAAELAIPDTAALSFLGRPGYSTWILPAVQNTNLLFLGFGAEEVESGVFVGDVLRMELASVTGAGDFAVFSFDGFGNPVVHMNSADGISAADFFLVTAGGHTDLNWAFNAPGTYRIGFRARGTLVDGNQEVVSEVAYYTFVVPEPLLPQPPEPDDSIAYKFEVVEAPGAEATYAFGINSAGLIVGRFNEAGVGRGYVRETGGVIVPTNFPGATFTETFGINSNGFIVGWYKSASSTNGFLLGTNGVFETIALPGATVTYALGINASNTIAGAYQDGAGVQHGFIRDAAGGVTSFDPPGSIYTEAYGINDAGTVVGYFVDGQGERGFARRTDGSFEVFDVSGADGSGILGINNAGTWTGFFEDADGVHGFVRSADGVLTALNFPDSSFTVALGIADDGVVVGYTADATDTVRGFIARSATRLKSGHTDIGVLFEGGAFEFEVHAEDTDTEYSPDAALLNLPPLTQTVVPTNASYAFLGAAGAPVWVLPGVENPKLLFLGLAAEEIEQGVFENDELRFALKGVEGPGHFALYSIDGFGVPQVHMNSGDGLDTNDVKSVQAGSHEDFYWAFTSPGLYRVKFQVSGTLVAGSQFIESEEVEFCFEVIGIETRLAIARSGGNATINFVTQDGLTYQLESAPAVTGPWANEGAAFLGTGREKTITVPLSPGAAFFRMKASAGN